MDKTVPSADKRPAASPAAELNATSVRTVLYVEDNLSNVRLVERVAAHRPEITLVVAMRGGVALELARQHRPSLILLDLHLPDTSGDEVLAALRADPDTSATPVVVLSADATSEQQERLRAGGATDYLTKPLDITRLLAILDGTASTGQPASAGGDGRDPLLDPMMVAALHELDTGPVEAGELAELVTTFIEVGRARLEELHVAAGSADHARVERVAHSLAGSSANFAAARVAGLCRQLESLATRGDSPAVVALLAELDESFARAEAALGDEFLSRDKAPSR